jgi:predicted nucleic acid-binding protein
LDSGPIIGLYNENDEWHARCEKFFGETSNITFVLTQAVIVEAVYYIQKDRSVGSAVDAVVSFLNDVANGIYILHPLDAASIGRIKNLRLKYRDHKKLDFADLSLVIAAEDLKIGEIVTVDQKDFSKLQWQRESKRGATTRWL